MLPMWTPIFARAFKEQELFECLTKSLVKNCIKNGIDHGAGIAKPCDKVKHGMVYFGLALGADGRQKVQDKKRRPQNDKGEENDAKHFGGFLFESNYATVTSGVFHNYTGIARVV